MTDGLWRIIDSHYFHLLRWRSWNFQHQLFRIKAKRSIERSQERDEVVHRPLKLSIINPNELDWMMKEAS